MAFPIPPVCPAPVAAARCYHLLVREWLRGIGPLDSLLDVGCGSSPAATWGAFRRRYTIDPLDRPPLPGVQAFRGLFPDDAVRLPALPRQCSVVLCLDVLSGYLEPAVLAASLLAIGQRVILSIPFGIPAPPEHPIRLPDPYQRLRTWFGRAPDRWEVDSHSAPPRLVAEFVAVSTICVHVGDVVWHVSRPRERFRFVAWAKNGGQRYARVRDGRHEKQIAAKHLRTG